MIRSFMPCLLAPLLFPLALMAQAVPSVVNYQGRLTDNTPQQNPLTATVNMQFEIWDAASGGTASPDRLWVEPASGSVPVAVTGGIFSVQLGANGVPVPASIFNSANPFAVRYLQIIANGETLAPRQQIGSTGNAFQAQNAYQATSAQFAGSANDSSQLGGVAAASYLLNTQTAFDSDRLGGIAAVNWQRSLSVASCPAGQFYNAIAQGGAAGCASAQSSLTPPVSLSANIAAAGSVFSSANTGTGYGISASSATGTGITVTAGGTGYGISASSATGTGITVTAGGSDGLYGTSTAAGGNGVHGVASNGASAYGVWGQSTTGYGVVGSGAVYGVYGSGIGTGIGVYGTGNGSAGVKGISASSNGVAGSSSATGYAGAAVAGSSAGGGTALYGVTTSTTDATLVVRNDAAAGTGDLIRGYDTAINQTYRVDNLGSISQPSTSNGAVKAAAIVYCSSTAPSVSAWFNQVNGAAVTIVSGGSLAGTCTLNFGFPLTGRFILATINLVAGYSAGASIHAVSGNTVGVELWYTITGTTILPIDSTVNVVVF